MLSRSNWNLEVLVFQERGKPEYPGKNRGSEQGQNPTTNSTHIWHTELEPNPGHTGGRRALSPLRHPCFPSNQGLQVLRAVSTGLIPLISVLRDALPAWPSQLQYWRARLTLITSALHWICPQIVCHCTNRGCLQGMQEWGSSKGCRDACCRTPFEKQWSWRTGVTTLLDDVPEKKYLVRTPSAFFNEHLVDSRRHTMHFHFHKSFLHPVSHRLRTQDLYSGLLFVSCIQTPPTKFIPFCFSHSTPRV